ncbi:DUF3613 domain-containing protein [Jeongeupia naejangsanensis]|uniref:DUF3613 domain-containing protein n=1 Tax=Jeongeupia naejangsanensis TaxID=613195 RepID=A0ABS2BJU5_9NEIS|nr:DUF3613 domain-containing protein [Jeongeupia naejangsanensis]MBM3115858.1 DUF3613 domain-containing protein [Jeongeupia naejangsanensis]
MKYWTLFVLLASASTLAAEAEYHIGDATRAWLALQVSGESASPLPARSEEAVKAYQRYQKSFETPMPGVDVESVKTSGRQ